jgi:hypothetical protein
MSEATRGVSPVPEHLHTVTPRLVVRDGAAAIDLTSKRSLRRRSAVAEGVVPSGTAQIAKGVVREMRPFRAREGCWRNP